MKNNFKRVLRAELFPVLLFPAAIAAIYLLYFLIAFIPVVVSNNEDAIYSAARAIDKTTLNFLYAAMCATFIACVYRSFAYAPVYAKLRVNPGTVFAARLLLFSAVSAALTLLFMGAVTLVFAVFRSHAPQLFFQATYYPMFSFIGKNWLYSLFILSTAAFAAVALSLANVVASAVNSKRSPLAKVIAGFVSTAVAALAFYIGIFAVKCVPLTLGMDGFFGYPIPFGYVSYDFYSSLNMQYLLFCGFSWNICNIATALIGALIVLAGLCADAFFALGENACYSQYCCGYYGDNNNKNNDFNSENHNDNCKIYRNKVKNEDSIDYDCKMPNNDYKNTENLSAGGEADKNEVL